MWDGFQTVVVFSQTTSIVASQTWSTFSKIKGKRKERGGKERKGEKESNGKKMEREKEKGKRKDKTREDL